MDVLPSTLMAWFLERNMRPHVEQLLALGVEYPHQLYLVEKYQWDSMMENIRPPLTYVEKRTYMVNITPLIDNPGNYQHVHSAHTPYGRRGKAKATPITSKSRVGSGTREATPRPQGGAGNTAATPRTTTAGQTKQTKALRRMNSPFGTWPKQDSPVVGIETPSPKIAKDDSDFGSEGKTEQESPSPKTAESSKTAEANADMGPDEKTEQESPSSRYPGRCTGAQELKPVATSRERSNWAPAIDLEDVDGHYLGLGSGCCKTSTDKRLLDVYTNQEARAATQPTQPVSQGTPFSKAWDCLGTTTLRLEYDLRCEERRAEWLKASKYDDAEEVEKEQRAKRYAQMVKTMAQNQADFKANEVAPLLRAIARLTPKQGKTGNPQMPNNWRLAVGKCAKLIEDQAAASGVKATACADIAMVVRRARTVKWNPEKKDGVYRNMKQRVKLNIQAYKDGKMNLALRVLMPLELKKWMVSHTMQPFVRGAIPLSRLRKTECRLLAWIDSEYALKHRITRSKIFRQALFIDPLHCGRHKKGFMGRMFEWFYKGFNKRYRITNRKISGAGQKLPDGWQKLHAELKERVKRHCVPHETTNTHGTTKQVLGVDDAHFCNTDHVPTYVEDVGSYSWGESDSERRQIATGGKEHNRFTTQLSIKKDGTKVIPFVIFKAEDTKRGENGMYGLNTVRASIDENIPDVNGIHFPPKKDMYITVTKTANSNWEKTIEIIKEVILPAMPRADGQHSAILLDDFAGHKTKEVKDFIADLHPRVSIVMIAGGLTPVAQPLDKAVNKVFKGYMREQYDEYILTCALNAKGHQVPPTRQLCCQWIKVAWDAVPTSMCRKAWSDCGYDLPHEEERARKRQFAAEKDVWANGAARSGYQIWVDDHEYAEDELQAKWQKLDSKDKDEYSERSKLEEKTKDMIEDWENGEDADDFEWELRGPERLRGLEFDDDDSPATAGERREEQAAKVKVASAASAKLGRRGAWLRKDDGALYFPSARRKHAKETMKGVVQAAREEDDARSADLRASGAQHQKIHIKAAKDRRAQANKSKRCKRRAPGGRSTAPRRRSAYAIWACEYRADLKNDGKCSESAKAVKNAWVACDVHVKELYHQRADEEYDAKMEEYDGSSDDDEDEGEGDDHGTGLGEEDDLDVDDFDVATLDDGDDGDDADVHDDNDARVDVPNMFASQHAKQNLKAESAKAGAKACDLSKEPEMSQAEKDARKNHVYTQHRLPGSRAHSGGYGACDLTGAEVVALMKLTGAAALGNGSCWLYAAAGGTNLDLVDHVRAGVSRAQLQDSLDASGGLSMNDQRLDRFVRVIIHSFLRVHAQKLVKLVGSDANPLGDTDVLVDSNLKGFPDAYYDKGKPGVVEWARLLEDGGDLVELLKPAVKGGDPGGYSHIVFFCALAKLMGVSIVMWNAQHMAMKVAFQVVALLGDDGVVREVNWSPRKILDELGKKDDVVHVLFNGFDHYDCLLPPHKVSVQPSFVDGLAAYVATQPSVRGCDFTTYLAKHASALQDVAEAVRAIVACVVKASLTQAQEVVAQAQAGEEDVAVAQALEAIVVRVIEASLTQAQEVAAQAQAAQAQAAEEVAIAEARRVHAQAQAQAQAAKDLLFQKGCDVEALFKDSSERWRATIYGNFDNGDVQLRRQVDKRQERVPRGACRPASARRKRSKAPDAFCPTTAAENQAKTQKAKRRREVEAKAKSAKNAAPSLPKCPTEGTFYALFAKTKEKRRRQEEQQRAEAKRKGAAQQTKRAAAKRKGAAQQTNTTAPKRKRVAPPSKTAPKPPRVAPKSRRATKYEEGTCNSLSDARKYEKRVRAPKVLRVCPIGVCTKKTVDFCVCKLPKKVSQ